jgi:hypothetical protein
MKWKKIALPIYQIGFRNGVTSWPFQPLFSIYYLQFIIFVVIKKPAGVAAS